MQYVNKRTSLLIAWRLFFGRGVAACVLALTCLALASCAGSGPLESKGKSRDKPPSPVVDKSPIDRNLIIVQSNASRDFGGVAHAIAEKWKGDVTALNLAGGAGARSELVRLTEAHPDRVVVAVGLPAALAIRKLNGIRAIFCQVFNYQDHHLVTPWMKGVSAVPPVDQQFRVSKQLNPRLKRLGVVTGPRLRDLIAEARAAAAAYGIEIEHREVRSDLEALYAFKTLSPKIQALWLLPDNRVLSGNTIREMLSHSRKRGIQVIVFSEQLLALGGTVSVASAHADIAEQVVARAAQILSQRGRGVPGRAVHPLTQLDLKINSMAVERLGLRFPAELKSWAYVP